MSFRSGFLAILGRPNAGKSTLMNALVGAKVAIVSSKPQTTRNRIQGILTRKDAQLIFIDTPGIHKPINALNQQMMHFVYESLEGIDLLLLIVDATQEFGAGDRFALEIVRRYGGKSFLLLNKIDLLAKPKLLPLIDFYSREHTFNEVIPLSALTGENLDVLLAKCLEYLPEGPMYYPAEQITDQPERFIAAELIREKIIEATRQEVPHATAVVVDKWQETPRLVRIHASIFVEREGQKGIVIGKGGVMLKKIGTEARQEVEALLHTKVFLELYVKVKPDWRESPAVVKLLDWRAALSDQEEAEEIAESDLAGEKEE